MSFDVEIQPSGHRFAVEQGETVLEAALRAGLALRYGCANGSCGECAGTVVSGRFESIRFHDHVIPDAQRRRGRALLCAIAPSSDLVVEASEASGVDDIPRQRLRARIARIEPRDDTHVVAHVKVIRGQVLRFLAGQRATLELPGLEPRHTWIASCPCDGLNLRFHFSSADDPEIVEYLRSRLRRTDKIGLDGPAGRLTLDESSPRAIVVLARDTAYAPAESLVEHALNLELEQEIRLVWIASRPDRHYALNYCRAWADAIDNFDYDAVVGADSELDGAIDAALGRCTGLGDYDLYVAGTAPFVTAALAAAARAGVPGERVRMDALDPGARSPA